MDTKCKDSILEMKYIFLGGVSFDEVTQEIESNSIGMSQVAANNFQSNFIQRLRSFSNSQLQVISLPYTGTWGSRTKLLVFKGGKRSVGELTYGNFITVPGFYSFSRYKSAIKCLKAKVNSGTMHLIFVYAVHTPFLKAAIKIKNMFPDVVRLVLIIPDLPDYTRDTRGIKGRVIKVLKEMHYKNLPVLLKDFDGTICFSPNIRDKIGFEGHHKVLLGLPPAQVPLVKSKSRCLENTMSFLYSGVLDFRFGIKELIDAFKRVEKTHNEYRLIICGAGNAATYAKEASKNSSAIEFLGVMNHSEVLNLQQQVDILVNPRPSRGEFTKFSFPSKMFEYCASGKPILGFKLESYPDELLEAMIVPEEESTDGLVNAILDCGRMSRAELQYKSEKGKGFLKKYASIESFNEMLDSLVKSILK